MKNEKGPKPPNCTILDSSVFENFALPNEPFAKTLQSPEIGIYVNFNLCRMLASFLESSTRSDERFKIA